MFISLAKFPAVYVRYLYDFKALKCGGQGAESYVVFLGRKAESAVKCDGAEHHENEN